MSGRQRPIGSSPIRSDPMPVRTSFSTFAPTASIMRRTCLLRPSVMVSSRKLYFSLSRNRVTSAGRVGPSLRTTPRRSCSIWSSVMTVDAFTMYVLRT